MGPSALGVLQPVGQVELEFRRVGGREVASGKRKTTQVAGGLSPGAGRAEPGRGPAGAHRGLRTWRGLPLSSTPGLFH